MAWVLQERGKALTLDSFIFSIENRIRDIDDKNTELKAHSNLVTDLPNCDWYIYQMPECKPARYKYQCEHVNSGSEIDAIWPVLDVDDVDNIELCTACRLAGERDEVVRIVEVLV